MGTLHASRTGRGQPQQTIQPRPNTTSLCCLPWARRGGENTACKDPRRLQQTRCVRSNTTPVGYSERPHSGGGAAAARESACVTHNFHRLLLDKYLLSGCKSSLYIFSFSLSFYLNFISLFSSLESRLMCCLDYYYYYISLSL